MFSVIRIILRGTLLLLVPLISLRSNAQTNLLTNGGFEDVNTCTEYTAECGVEGWFYLRDVKAQMLSNETDINLLGNNSFGIFYNWLHYDGFTPVIGTLLPCRLQPGKTYTFSGMINAKLNPNLIFQLGVCMGQKFYVPKRPFTTGLEPDTILSVKRVPNSNFMAFQYRFVADGNELYLTFGSYIKQDLTNGKKPLTGTQTVSVILDNFNLEPDDKTETVCADFAKNQESIYQYNYRHKEMDYSLYGKGQLNIVFHGADSNRVTRITLPPAVIVPDTLKLGDVFFDFNKDKLKPDAIAMLEKFFIDAKQAAPIDSIHIEGHTDSIGSDEHNLQLSKARCESIRQWLLQNNIAAPTALKISPFGRSRPVATNRTPGGRALNRRVEMLIFRHKHAD